MAMSRDGYRFSSLCVVEMSVSCRNLEPEHNHAYCILYRMESNRVKSKFSSSVTTSTMIVPPEKSNRQEEQLGRTEIIRDCCHPDFHISFRLDYQFEEDQHLCLRCFSETSSIQSTNNPSNSTYLGGCYFTMGQLVGSMENSLHIPLRTFKSTNQSFCLLRASQMRDGSEVLRFQFKAQNLRKDGIFFTKRNINPKAQIQVLGPDNKTWKSVWQSSTARNTPNPVWDMDEISISALTQGDFHRAICIQILNFPDDGFPPHEIGGLVLSVNELLRVPNTYDIMKSNRNGVNRVVGKLLIESADILHRPSMLDYVLGGCDIGLLVAVDFTLSNGDPKDPKSLHYRNDTVPNEYQQAIFKIGTIIEHYATNKNFPMWGFGAKVNHLKQDCLLLGGGSGGGSDTKSGVQGLLDAYNSAFLIPGFDLSGPTHFVPILRAAAQWSIKQQQLQQHNGNRQSYSILVILTDGVVTDMKQTVDKICDISETAPLSIIIIGVGNADFRKMEFLDSDDGFLRDSKGECAARDIVQFVPFRKYASNIDKLTSQVLQEIPKQMVSYFLSRNIKPNVAIHPSPPPY
jgi:hypothetical protein